MDVYNLINSKTIGTYCRQIKHQFNTLETSVIIFRCKNISIAEKIELYNEIISNPTLYPDMKVKGQYHIEGERNAVDLIKMEMERLDFLLETFNKPDDGAIFTLDTFEKLYEPVNGREAAWMESHRIFKTLHDVNKYIKQEEKGTKRYRISKTYFYDENHIITLEYRKNPQHTFDCYDISYDIFHSHTTLQWKYDDSINYCGIGTLFLLLPTPFKKGDIITNGKDKAVIYWMCNKDKRVLEQYADGCFKDNSDMQYLCYFVNYYNCDSNRSKIEMENFYDYDEFEYCTEELKGLDRMLKAISNYLKHKFCLDLLMAACNHIIAEDNLEYKSKDFIRFTDKGLELAGIKRKKK